MRGNHYIFDSVQLLYYKCHKINFELSWSNIESPDWIKNKKATINSKNKDGKCFQYAVTFALSYGEIESYQERVLNIKPFITKIIGMK